MRIERHTPRPVSHLMRRSRFARPRAKFATRTGRSSFRSTGSKCPPPGVQVAADVLAQKYFRKAGVPARLKRVEENAIPSFLWRGIPDEAALDALPKAERFVSEIFGQAGFRPSSPALGPIGAGRANIRLGGGCPGLLRRIALHAGKADGGAQFAAMVQHRPALGLWHQRTEPGPLLCRFRNGQARQIEIGYEHPQPHACFIQSVADDLVNEGGIMDLWVREARLFKYGSGTGSNISKLRWPRTRSFRAAASPPASCPF